MFYQEDGVILHQDQPYTDGRGFGDTPEQSVEFVE
jgi:hypothetical protein